MNDWTPVILALAGAITNLAALLVFYVHWRVSQAKSDYKQDRAIEQNRDIIKEQVDVKVALNGSTALIPKIDTGVESNSVTLQEIKEIVTH